MKILVIGGGIGGLSMALSLHAAGIEAMVFESVARVIASGLGINLQPNAARELIELGLGDDLAAVAIETAELTYFNKHGQLILSEPRGLAAGYRWPQFSIHRGELLMILLDQARRRLGAENVRLGTTFTGFEQDETGVTAHFTDRTTGAPLPPVRGDALIGADGIHSTVRRQLHPGEGTPVYGGPAFRGSAYGPPFLTGKTWSSIGHRGQRVVIYPMSRTLGPGGLAHLNFVLSARDFQFEAQQEGWDRRVPNTLLAEIFKEWKFGWIDIAAIVAAAEGIYEFPRFDRDPLPRWSFGRVTLMGDAAHPMRAAGSQAGSQAVVDARVLARALALAPTPERAFRDYEAERLPAMNEIVLLNRSFGPEAMMDVVEERAPGGFTNIDDVIPRAEREELSRSYKLAAGFDAEKLNGRDSLGVRRPVGTP